MGTIVRLPERSSKQICVPTDVFAADDCEIALRAITDQLAAVASINENLDKGIDVLRKCLSELDRIVQLFDNGPARIKLRTRIKSLEASLMLASIELNRANRAVSTAILGQ